VASGFSRAITVFVASGFSRKAVAVVNLWIASRSLPPEGGSHTPVNKTSTQIESSGFMGRITLLLKIRT
jgi:hypothetical protein